MAASWLNLTMKFNNRDSAWLVNKLFSKITGTTAAGTALGGKLSLRRAAKALADMIVGAQGGVHDANVWLTTFNDAGVKPAGNIACVQANAAGDTVTFTFGTVGIVFTEGAAGLQGFARGASNTTCAANLAAAINAHPVLGGLVLATPSVGNCALAAKLPTGLLHALTLSTSDGTAFSFTQLTGGTVGVPTVFPQHLLANRTP